MYKVVFLALLLLSLTLAQESVLSQSGDASAEVEVDGSTNTSDLPSATSTTSGTRSAPLALVSAPTKPSSWDFLQQNTLGGDSKWVSPGGDFALKPIGYLATYTITFYTDCPQNGVTLYFAATGSSYVNLNGEWLLTGAFPYPGYNPHKVELKKPTLKCGCNTLKIYVYNAWWSSPAALIYSLYQDTTGCYNCTNLGVTFYNKETCQCECASEPCKCTNPLQQWFDYPKCGCMCPKSLICPRNQYFNRKSCKCECLPKCCPKDYVQDPDSCLCRRQVYCLIVEDCKIGYKWDPYLCQCVPKCPLVKRCNDGQYFNYDTCECECSKVASCVSPLKWNSDTCKCQCPYLALCKAPWTWNSQTCKCECQIMCIATMRIDEQNCKCIPLYANILTTPITPTLNPNVLDSSLIVSGGG